MAISLRVRSGVFPSRSYRVTRLALVWLAWMAGAFAAERLKVRIGVEDNSAPLSFVDAQQQPSGFAAELLRAVGQVEGIDFEVKAGPWSWISREFQNRDLDALANVVITDERQATMDFTIGHAFLHAITYSRHDEARIRHTSSFAGKSIALVPGALSHLIAQRHNNWGGRLKFYPTRQATLQAVKNGECDFALHIRPARDNPEETLGLRREFVDDLIHRFHIAVHRGDIETVRRINEGLAVIMRNGVFERLYTKWIGPIEPHELQLSDLRPFFLPVGLAGLAIIAVFVWQQRISSERKRMAESLLESEARFRAISERSLAGIYIVQDERLTYVNPALARIYGYETHEVMGRPPQALIHPEDRGRVTDAIRHRIVGETRTVHYTARGVKKDGELIEVEVMGTQVEIDGRPAMIGNILNITDRAQAAAALLVRESDLTEAQRAALVGSWRLMLADNRMTWTEQLYRLHGLDPASPPPDHAAQARLFTAESWARLSAGLADARMLGASYDLELEFMRADGSRGWMVARGGPIYDGQGKRVGLRGMAQDITERKRTEGRLRQLSRVVEQAPISIVVTDLAGVIEYVNPHFTAVSGYSLAEVMGQNLGLLRPGQVPARLNAAMWQALTAGRVWRGETRSVKKSGESYDELAVVAPVTDESGAITHYVAVKEDVTQRKSLEKQLFETQRLESIGLLASGIAHDLNNILTPILLSIELLRIKYPAEDDSLNRVEQCARRGTGIVRQVLTFSRGMDGVREPLRLSRLVKEIDHLMSETLPRNIALSCTNSAEADTVRVDPTQIHQVLLNLAVNARDAMPAGGQLTFTLSNECLCSEAAAEAAGAQPGKYVVISVSDTGEGIPPENLTRIFDPFFTTKPRGQGTGLGLSTVHGIVRSHGGFVQVQSELQVGTTFRVYLPLVVSAESAAPLEVAPPVIHGDGRLVLVADDEVSIRMVAGAVLARFGFATLLVENGQQAVVAFRENRARVKLVLLDRMMPGMDGEQAAKLIHQLAPEVPIVLSTGLVTADNLLDREAELREAGIVTVLRKPYAENELMRILGTYLN